MLHKLFSTILLSTVLLCSCGNSHAPSSSVPDADTTAGKNTSDALRSKLAAYINAKHINIGIAIMHLEQGDTLSVNGQEHYAMMSVCKFPQAITLLHLVDEGKLSRDVKIHITPYDLTLPTRSSLQNDHPKAPFDLSIPEALAYSIGQSDNVSSNVIFALDGGPAAVEAYIRSLGVAEIGVGVDYRHMRSDSLYRNWITPCAATQLLNKFYTQKILSDTSRATIWKAMVEAPNGKNRLPGLLPVGTVVGHKTGTSSRDSANLTTAFNDIGILQLPSGKHIALAVFIANSPLTDDENAQTIAELARMAWDHYSIKQ